MRPTLDQLRAAAKRYEDFVTAQLRRTRWYGCPPLEPQARVREEWINERRSYIQNLILAEQAAPLYRDGKSPTEED